jgi:hypothetical protein
MTWLTEIGKTISKFIWNHKRPKKPKQSSTLRQLEASQHLSSTILHSYSKQSSMAVGYKQTHGPIEQNGQPRNKSTHLQPTDFGQRCQEYTLGERPPLQWLMLGKLDNHMQRTIKLDPVFYCRKDTNSKWIKDLNTRHEITRRSHGRMLHKIELDRVCCFFR